MAAGIRILAITGGLLRRRRSIVCRFFPFRLAFTFAERLFRPARRGQAAELAHWRAPRLIDQLEQRPHQRLHKVLIAALLFADLRQDRFPVGGHIRTRGHLRQGVNQRPASVRGVDITPLFGQETALKQQLDNPGAGRFCAETVGGAEDLLQDLYPARNGQSRSSPTAAWRR